MKDRMIEYVFEKAQDQLYGNDKIPVIVSEMMPVFYSKFDEPEMAKN